MLYFVSRCRYEQKLNDKWTRSSMGKTDTWKLKTSKWRQVIYVYIRIWYFLLEQCMSTNNQPSEPYIRCNRPQWQTWVEMCVFENGELSISTSWTDLRHQSATENYFRPTLPGFHLHMRELMTTGKRLWIKRHVKRNRLYVTILTVLYRVSISQSMCTYPQLRPIMLRLT